MWIVVDRKVTIISYREMMKHRSKLILVSYVTGTLLLVLVGYLIGISSIHVISNGNNNSNSIISGDSIPIGTDPFITNFTSYKVTSSIEDINSKNRALGNDISLKGGTDSSTEDLRRAESSYETTIHSCLGKYCFDDPVQRDGTDVVRIGILMPDMLVDGSKDALQGVLAACGLVASDKLEIVYSSNVPPYGYGKNHGWSRIIRISKGLFSNAVELLSAHDLSSDQLSTLLAAQIRQLMRWHCRLSHVAAHTAMLTVFTDDFAQRPIASLDSMLSFMGYKASRENLLAAINSPSFNTLIKVWDSSLSTNGTTKSLFNIGARTIEHEMAITNQLTRWPCKSFRDYKHHEHLKSLPIPLNRLVADCDAPHVKCSVAYDVREFDALRGGKV